MPPQMLSREKYSNKCDIWSLGIMFYEMLTGTPPFLGISIEEFKRNLNKAVYDLPTDCVASVEAVEIINACLQQSERDRYSIMDLVNHAYLKPIASDEFESMKELRGRALKVAKEDKSMKKFLVDKHTYRFNSKRRFSLVREKRENLGRSQLGRASSLAEMKMQSH